MGWISNALNNAVGGAPAAGEAAAERYAYGEKLTRAERHAGRIDRATTQARLADRQARGKK